MKTKATSILNPKSILLICLFTVTAIFYANGQNKLGKLWGTTSNGGDSSGGVMFNYDSITAYDSIVYGFPTFNTELTPKNPYYEAPLQATDGNIYFMAEAGGKSGFGAIVKYDSTLHTFSTLVTFNGTNGSNPYGGLIQANDGNLYGMTYGGGASSDGTIFKCSLSGVLTTLVSFNGTNGKNPYGSLMQAADGNLYGMTYAGGASSVGTIFQCSLAGTLTTLVSFNTTNGANPYGNLIQAADNNLYGMTYGGGGSSDGTIFSCTTSGTLTTLVNFNNTNGKNPYGSLLQAADDSLYGMTYAGGASNSGVVFKYDIATSKIRTLVTFSGTNGMRPYGALMQAKDANMYGLTSYGGTGSNGVVFKISTSGTYTNLSPFGPLSAHPYGSLMQATDGGLYAVSFLGGNNSGSLFKSTTTGTVTTLAILSYTAIGGSSFSGLIQAKDGNLYGTTNSGGGAGFGTVFEYNTTLHTVSTLASFTGYTGQNPQTTLLQASDGNLYGVTYNGGTAGNGTMYEYNMTTGKLITLHSFNGAANGVRPYGSLIEALDGKLYGTTTLGGASGDGIIYSYSLSGTFTDVYDFSASTGQRPYGSLIQAIDSNFYGMTQDGGSSGFGVIFKYTTKGVYSTLFNFTGAADGQNPYGNLIQASDSNLYGMVTDGGSTGDGAVFKYNIKSSTYTNIVTFAGATNGQNPIGSLIQASDGMLYGMTEAGGSGGGGVVFKSTLSGTSTTLINLAAATSGSIPEYTEMLEVMSDPAIAVTRPCPGTVLDATIRGAKSPYSFKWSTGETTDSITVKKSGTYSFTVTDARGIKMSSSINVIYDSLAVNGGSGTVICNGTPTGLSASGTGGSTSLTYTWMPGTLSGASQSVSPSSTTTYTVTATDGTCSVTATELVTVNPTPALPTVGDNNMLCVGSTLGFTASSTGATSYTWTGPNGFSSSSATPSIPNITLAASGTYSVTASEAACVSSLATIAITVNALPTVGITGTSNITAGSNDVLTANGTSTSYIWSDGSTNDTANVAPLGNATYTVTGTDGNGCSDTATFKVTVSPAGVNSISASGTTSLYPNPSVNTISLSFEMQNAEKDAVIEVMDISGKEVMSESTTIGNGKVTTLNISSLSAGMYFVRVIANGNTQVVKFVKQ